MLVAGEVTGTIGAANALAEVIADGDAKVTLSANTHKATTFKLSDNANAEFEVADGGKLDGDVDAAGANGKLTFKGAGKVTGTIGAANALAEVIADGDDKVKLSANTHKATTFKLSNNANAEFEVADGGKLDGNVDAAGANGKLTFKGAGEVTGIIGATNALAEVITDGDDKVKLSANTHKATTFKLSDNANAEFEVADGGKLDGDVDAAGANGKLTFKGAGEVTGTIGATNALLEVTADGDDKVKLSANTHKATTFKLSNNANAEFEVADGGYKETGTTHQNLTISKRRANKAELILGARVAGNVFNLNGMSVTPEIHGFVNQDMFAKHTNADMRLEETGEQLTPKSVKPNKTLFNVGASLNAIYNSMEYGLGYDTHLANKYVGHQGTLKVRVNF